MLSLLLGCRLVGFAEPPLQPVTVCEVLQNLQAYDGKVAAIVGRYSFRQAGRWLGEQTCDPKPAASPRQAPNSLWIAYDPAEAPKPPAVLAVDDALLAQKLRDVKHTTTLTRFHFGSSDYDAWALIYGRIEIRKTGADSSPARLVCHGEAEVVFLNDDVTKPSSR